MIWMKAYIMERERFDGADIAHVLRCCVSEIDWPHLVRRFGFDWRVLLSHLILFGFVYPGERAHIPAAIMEDLVTRLRSEMRTAGPERLCRGTLLSRQQYLVDVQEWGLRDTRLEERVQMNEKDIADWTDAIAKEECLAQRLWCAQSPPLSFAEDSGLYNGGLPFGAGTVCASAGDGVADAAMSFAFASSSSFI